MGKRVQRGSRSNGSRLNTDDHYDYDKWYQAHYNDQYYSNENSFRNQHKNGMGYDYKYARENAEAIHRLRAPRPIAPSFSPQMQAQINKQYEDDKKRALKMISITTIITVVLLTGFTVIVEMHSPHRTFRSPPSRDKPN